MCVTEYIKQTSNSSSASDTSSCSSCSHSTTSNEDVACSRKRTQKADVDDDDDDDDGSAISKPRLGKFESTTLQHSSWLVLFSRCFGLFSCGLLVSVAISAFSIQLPFFLAPWSAKRTYLPAFYKYDPEHSFFDNTAWTYGTDYFLAIVMTILGGWIGTCGSWHSSSSPAWISSSSLSMTRTLRWESACLLWSYAVSVTAGGIAHQFYLTAEQRNSFGFMVLWALCVGSVTTASGWMGCIGTELLRQLYRQEDFSQQSAGPPTPQIPVDVTKQWWRKVVLPIIPEPFWIGFGIGTTVICILGYMSYQRPACDIFVAGTTQFVSTFYIMGVVGWSFRNHPYIRTSYRAVSLISWILNAPLLPMYPLLIQYTDWSLARVNTFLHCWLLAAWGLQGITLGHYLQALNKANSKPKKAVPWKKHWVATKLAEKET